MSLSQYGRKVSNTITRMGFVLVRVNVDEGFSIKRLDDVADEVVVTGDVTDFFTGNSNVELKGTTLDGEYSLVGATYDAGNDETLIGISTDITTTAGGGTIAATDFVNLGKVKGSAVNFEAVSTEPDSTGNVKELALDLEATTTLQQTTNTELSNLDTLNEYAMDVLYAATPTQTDVSASDENYFLIKGVTPVVSPSIDFMGEESNISFTVNLRVPPTKLSTNTITFR